MEVVAYLCILLITNIRLILAERRLFLNHDNIVYAMYQNIILDIHNDTTYVKYAKGRSKFFIMSDILIKEKSDKESLFILLYMVEKILFFRF